MKTTFNVGEIITAELTLTSTSGIHTSSMNGFFLFGGEYRFYSKVLDPLETTVVNGQWSAVTSGVSLLTAGGDFITGVTITILPSLPPVQLDWTNITNTGLTMNWINKSAATATIIDVATDSGFTNFIYHDVYVSGPPNTFHTVTGLTHDTIYYTRFRNQYINSSYSDYSNVISGTTISGPAILSAGDWIFADTGFNIIDPNTLEQGDTLRLGWSIVNTGESQSVPTTLYMFSYFDIDYLHPAYAMQSIPDNVIPTGSTIYWFAFSDLPDGNGTDIYAPTSIYLNGLILLTVDDTPVDEGYYPFYVQPCADDMEVSFVTPSLYNLTGNTAQSVSFRVDNLSCHTMLATDYELRAVYYSDNGSTIYAYHNFTVGQRVDITSGNYIIFGSWDEMIPNDWGNGGENNASTVIQTFGDVAALQIDLVL